MAEERPRDGRGSAGERIADEVRARYDSLRREPGANEEAVAREEARALALGRASEQAVRLSFVRAVTRVYDWSLPLGLCALLLALFTRELPLRHANRAEPPVASE
jgi:hypothetical protein